MKCGKLRGTIRPDTHILPNVFARHHICHFPLTQCLLLQKQHTCVLSTAHTFQFRTQNLHLHSTYYIFLLQQRYVHCVVQIITLTMLTQAQLEIMQKYPIGDSLNNLISAYHSACKNWSILPISQTLNKLDFKGKTDEHLLECFFLTAIQFSRSFFFNF
jgi:hypothetical protein